MTSRLTILYGSQTGNAEDVAKRIALKARGLGLPVLVQTIDDFQLKMLPRQGVIVFVCSTTGHGQEPENMKNFYNFIRRKDLPTDCLSKLRYAVYGLGDSSYAKFNYVAKILFKRLKDCGAQPLQDLVKADEQHEYGCDGIIYPKLEELWPLINNVIDKRIEFNPEPLASSYRVQLYGDQIQPYCNPYNESFLSKFNIHRAKCVLNQRVTKETHFQDTRFLSFQSQNYNLSYEPGDVCAILPANSDSNVDEFINILKLNHKQQFKCIKKEPDFMINHFYDFIPDGLSVRDLVKYYLDIQSVPKRSFFEYLWQFSTNEMEREKLREFATTEGQEELYDYCVKPKRNILEVLNDFPNTVDNIKFEFLFDLIPPIKPRSFSITSALSAHPNEIQLIVGVVKYRTIMRKPRLGLCSNYLANLKAAADLEETTMDNSVRFLLRKSDFKLPKDDNSPIVMIGPGLGIAPFRSFIEHRALTCDMSRDYLYFGCRYREADFYFEEQLNQFSHSNSLNLRVAYSREIPGQYVQELLREDSDIIKKLIENENATMYIAGNSKLPEDLRTLFASILSSELGDCGTAADKLVERLEVANRIQYDCW